MNNNNIILTGLRGSGKTKMGKLIAEKLNKEFFDIDEEVEKSEKMKISKIVELRGWEYFRAKESEITKEASNLKDTIIATGGGTIIDPDNAKELKKSGKIIYLYVRPEVCTKRILDDPNRPPLTNKETVEEEVDHLYKKRNGLYIKNSFIIFHRTEELEKDADELIKRLF